MRHNTQGTLNTRARVCHCILPVNGNIQIRLYYHTARALQTRCFWQKDS